MYSPVSKYSPEARKRSPYRSKGKSCGYYMRIVFFFSSLIQSLIIVSLVLFLVYGKQHDSASVERVQDLEMRFSRLSIENVDLTHQRQNLTKLLNITMREKARNDWDLANLMSKTNVSFHFLADHKRTLDQCILEKRILTLQGGNRNCPPEARVFGTPCNCGHEMELLKARMEYVKSNFTQTAMKMQIEMDQISKERDNLNLEAIRLRRDKSMHEKEIHFYKIKCKDDFVQSLSGVSNVSKAFLHKIDSLFSSHHAFQISCPKQKEYLEQIRTNCTNLSWEVEDRFQRYLNNVGDQVSTIQGENSRLTAENWRMSEDYRWCSQNRTGLIREHRQNIDRIQLKHDEEKEKLLKEKMKLNGNIELMESSVRLKNTEIQHLKEQLKQLNMSCLPRTGFGGLLPGGSSSRTSGTQTGSSWGLNTGSSSSGSSGSTGGLGQAARNPFGGSSSSSSNSFGSSFGSTGSNTGLGSNLGSTNLGFNKQPSTGLGSSNLGYGSSASNSGLGTSGLNKPASSNPGSSSFGSSFGSNPSSSGTGLNKQPGSTGLGSSAFGSSLGSSSSSSSSNSPSSSGSSTDRFGSSSNRFGASGATGASSSSLGSNFGSSSSSLGSSLGSGSSSSSRTTQNARGSSSNSFFGSSSSSSSQSLDSSLNKLSTSGRSSVGSSLGSSSSSSGSSSSTPSKSSFGSWWGLGGGTSTDQSKSGSGTQGRGASSSGGSFGSFGRNSAYTAPISVNEHLRDLQRIINPPGPEEKQELSRMLG